MRRPPAVESSRAIWRTMLVFLIPLMLSNVLQSATGTLNSIFLGRILGVRALAAVSAFFPVFFFLISFFIGISSASSVLIGQAYGAKNEERIKAVAGTTLTLALVAGLAVGIPAAIFAGPLLAFLGTPADVFAAATGYARVLFLALPLFFIYLAYTTFVRGTGDSRTPLIALVVSTIVTVALTPALILGWLGLPHLGVLAAAYATVIGNVAGLVYVMIALAVEGNPLAFDASIARHANLDPKLLLQLVRIGVPTGVQFVMISLAEIAVLSLVNRFGSGATAAYGAVNQITSYVQFPAISIGIASSIFGAQAIGARRTDRLREIARAGVTLNLAIGAVLIGLAYAGRDALLRVFITDPGVLQLADDLLAITLWSYLVFGTTAVLSGLMRASGTVLWPTLFSIISIWGVEVPVAYALAPHLGTRGIWIAYPVAFCSALVMQSSYYFLVWRRTKLTALHEAT